MPIDSHNSNHLNQTIEYHQLSIPTIDRTSQSTIANRIQIDIGWCGLVVTELVVGGASALAEVRV